MSSRIEKLAGRMTLWSGNRVQVGGNTVYVNAKPVVTPAAVGTYSSRRRAFLVAGNLARATHDVYGEATKDDKVVTEAMNKKQPSWNVASRGNDVYVNDLRIMTCADGDDQPAIVKNIQSALEATPAMLSKKELQQQNKAWTPTYGYKKDKKEKNA